MAKVVNIDTPNKPYEIVCETCEGCGIVRDEFKRNCFGVILCPNCNGHGAVAVEALTHVVHKYAATKENQCKFAN